MSETDEYTVLRSLAAMDGVAPPYVDAVRRLSGLDKPAFDAAVNALRADSIIFRASAPHGALLYLTMRGEAIHASGTRRAHDWPSGPPPRGQHDA